MILGDHGLQGNLVRVPGSWFDLHNAALGPELPSSKTTDGALDVPASDIDQTQVA